MGVFYKNVEISGQNVTINAATGTAVIRISMENHQQLQRIAAPGQSFNGVVTMLIDFWNEKHN